MITAYNADERVEEGLLQVLKDYLNDQIDINNALETDGIAMSHVDDSNIYPQYISTASLQGKMKPFPSICFYIYQSRSRIESISVDKDDINLRLALFTSGRNSAKLEKRYLAAIREVIEEHDEDITSCVFRGYVTGRKYYTPYLFDNNEDIYIAEMDITITVEVRK